MQFGRTPLRSQRYLPPDSQAPQVPLFPTEPPELQGHPRGVFFWVKQVFLFPFRLMGLLLLVLLIPGSFQMWQLPTLANENKLEVALLTLRTIDHEKSAHPFTPLGYRDVTQSAVIDLGPGEDHHHTALTIFTAGFYKLRAVSTSVERAPDKGYRYRVVYNHHDPRTVEATTPHLNISLADVAEANKSVRRLFKDKKQRREVQEWGESLFWTEWLRQNSLSMIPKKAIPAPQGGTKEEQLWLVWQVLCGKSPAAPGDLFRLPELFREAFPKAEDRKTALAWAQRLYNTLEADFASYQNGLKASLERKRGVGGPKIEAWEENNPYEPIFVDFKRVLPPKTKWSYYWLLYRYVGLSKESREAARAHWLSCFPEEREKEVLEMGKKIEDDRRRAMEPLPAVPETLPLVCVVERLTGSDSYGERCRSTVKSAFSNDPWMLKFTIMSAYPNDEIFYLLASKDRLHLHPIGWTRGTLWDRVQRLVGSALFPLVASLAFATLLQWILVPLLMPKSARPLWKKHLEGRGKEPLWLWLCSVIFFAAIGALATPITLFDGIAVQMGSFLELFMGSLAATAVGGVLIGTIRRFLAAVLIAFGVDVEAVWIDEALGILLGAFVLYHFGNDVLAITLFALADLAPGLLVGWLHRRPHTPKPEAFSPVLLGAKV
jgi:hypothetical protein